MSLRRLALALALAPSLFAAPAAAATAPVADFRPGQTLGIGLAGVSWDYGLGRGSLGAQIGNPAGLAGGGNNRIKAGARGMWRFLEAQDINVASLVGLEFDPGAPGGRSYLVPDVGLAVAYRFKWGDLPLAARFNVSLTVDQGQQRFNGPIPSMPYAPDGGGVDVAPVGNVFQRMILGPNTMIGVGLTAMDRYELTLGGGTLVGLRIAY